MAVKERPGPLGEVKVLDVGELVKQLESKWGAESSALTSEGKIQKVTFLPVRSPQFDMTFFFDLIVSIVVFAASVACYIYRIPVLGDPFALLLGPIVGLLLSLKHRPPR